MNARRWLFLSCVVASLSIRSRAAAQASPERVSWTYRAPPDCPGSEAFESEFRARTARAELVRDASPVGMRAFAVALTSETGRASGRLEIRQSSGATSTREVTGRTCREVVSALSLIAALAVDPDASIAPAPTPPAVARPDTPPTVDTSEAPRWFAAVGIEGGVIGGLFPTLTPRGAVFVEAITPRSLPLLRSFRFSAESALGGWSDAPRGEVRFRWFAAALEFCPVGLDLADAVRASACAFAEAGVLRGEGAGVDVARAESRRWVAMGGLARLRWTLGKSLFLEVDGGLRVPLARDAFVFQLPERLVVHEVPAVLGSGAFGLGLRLP